jgi:hypothetical protein
MVPTFCLAASAATIPRLENSDGGGRAVNVRWEGEAAALPEPLVQAQTLVAGRATAAAPRGILAGEGGPGGAAVVTTSTGAATATLVPRLEKNPWEVCVTTVVRLLLQQLPMS